MTTAIDAPVLPERLAPLSLAKRAQPTSLSLVETKRQWHWHRAGAGVNQDDIRDVRYFGLLASRLRRHDLITILAEDESWEVECVVERVMREAAEIRVRKVYPRTSINHAGRAVDDLGEYASEWRAGMSWCIIRRSDDCAVVRGHSDETTAIAEWRAKQPRRAA